MLVTRQACGPPGVSPRCYHALESTFAAIRPFAHNRSHRSRTFFRTSAQQQSNGPNEPEKEPGRDVDKKSDWAPEKPVVDPATADVDRQLSKLWETMKSDMKKGADPESARLLDELKYEDLVGPNPTKFFRELASAQLGPILEALGINEDPFDFFVEVVKLATFLQFVAVGMAFYSTELWAHADAGAAVRVSGGLLLGFLTRPAFKVEQFMFPVYNDLLGRFFPQATYEVPATAREDAQGTLNALGVAIAAAFLVPQALWHWDTPTSCSFVTPLAAGWLTFDIAYIAALLVQIRRGSD